MSVTVLMPNKPAPALSFFFVFFLIIWISIALFVVLISWLDVREPAAILIGSGFALVAAGMIAGLTSQPVKAALDEISLQRRQSDERLQALEAQSSQAQAILDSMVEGVCVLDGEGRVLWVNPSAEKLFNVQSKEATGKRLAEVFRQPELESMIGQVLQQRKPLVQEVGIVGPVQQTMSFQIAPCEGGAGGASIVVVAQDVSDVRKLESMRRDFVANVSHELKTPLTSIKGLVETLLSGALEDSANNRRFVALIEEDAARLTRLIDDLLELSQIESKATPLRLQPVALRQFFEELEARFRNQLDAKGVFWDLKVPTGTPLVEADPDRLRQIFVNLFDNAIKFNKPNGRVTVSADADAAWVRITVADTGAGIPESDLPRIFERFYRVDKARSRELGGTGLGLAIVKHLIELHHGRIDVVSRSGEGSAFTVTLPIVAAA